MNWKPRPGTVPASMPALLMALSMAFFAAGCHLHFTNYTCKASAREVCTFERTDRIDLETFNGRIEVRRGGGEQIRLTSTITCHARTDEEANDGLRCVQKEWGTKDGRLVVKYSEPKCEDVQLGVDLEAEVPEEADVVARSSNGGIHAEGLRGDLDLETSNGEVKSLDCGSGAARLETSNGGIRFEGAVGSLKARTSNGGVRIDASRGVGERIDAETSNGSVECVLPDSFSGELEAETSLAGIRCDFPATVEGPWQGQRLRGRIGTGGPTVRLNTSNGSIRILRGPAAVPVEMPPAPGAGSPTRPPSSEGTRKI